MIEIILLAFFNLLL